MMLGIVLHAGLAYQWPEWAFLDWTVQSDKMSFVSDSIHMFRMPAFFFLSGFFGALLWERRGARAMLKNRVARIVLPFFAFILIVTPLDMFASHFGRHIKAHGESPLQYALNVLLHIPFPHNTIHLWFLYHLIYVTGFTVLLVYWLKRLGWTWPGFISLVRRVMESPWLFAGVLGGINFLWCWVFEWGHIPTDVEWIPRTPEIIVYYFGWYGLGWVLFVSRAAMERFHHGAWTFVGVGAVATALRNEEVLRNLGIPISPEESGMVWWWLWASAGLVGFTRGFMGLFLRYCGSGSPVWRYLSDSSYWVYLIHLPLTVLVPSLLLGWDTPLLVKFTTSVLLTLVVSWVSYDALIRPTFVGQFLNGRRYPAWHRTGSMCATVLAVVCLGVGMAEYPTVSERPPPWRKGHVPSELLADESVVYPMSRLKDPPDGMSLEHCVGVDRYILCIDEVKPGEMSAACGAFGVEVAQLETPEEQIRVSRLASKLTRAAFWVAVSDSEYEGWWRWPDGTVLRNREAPWHSSEPNNWGGHEHCAALNWHGEIKWIDIGCNRRMSFICEGSISP